MRTVLCQQDPRRDAMKKSVRKTSGIAKRATKDLTGKMANSVEGGAVAGGRDIKDNKKIG
jgi:hypothetical protein